ncbi:hypothetical protein ALI22I_05330 [Saccharothrix sp. ALI-22-I]|uniref:hypothetical protein n=1 Tax=Saccharothrix sp. ALI-22-I TaxID=1933778 RepID=UPI00097C8098|nr:hypothetical protein [Saccharothrix sp. ALI-22-I]ONI92210.1 hypothetical protein ALI22I_05330 [Saccharothrix sp. ALI-22-I]
MAGFVFDPAGVEAVLEDLRKLRDDLLEDVSLARYLVEVTGPRGVPASELMTNSARFSGEMFRVHNEELRSFVDRYIGKLTASRDEYLRADENGRDEFERG